MKKLHITLIFSLTAAFELSAQDLVKEIDVDRTIVPAEREASRPASPTPAIFTPKVAPVSLNISDRYEASAITPLVSIPAPATWGAVSPLTPYRGYIGGGYLPVYNLGITAGYQILGGAGNNARSADPASAPATELGIWGMYNGDSYKYAGDKYNDHFLRLGLNGSHTFTPAATLKADISYRNDHFTTPYVADDKQVTSIFDARLAFLGKCSLANYTVSADVLHFGFADALSSVEQIHGKAMKQTQVKITAGGLFNLNGNKNLRPGVTLSYDYLHTNNIAAVVINPDNSSANPGSGSKALPELTTKTGGYGVLRIDPHMLYKNGDFEARAGVNVSIATGNYNAVRLAPNIALAYRPAQPYSVWATLDGGMGQNRIYDLYERDYTTTPPLALKPYNIPVSLRAGVRVGPFAGFAAGVHLGYAISRDMAIPWLDTPMSAGLTTERKLDGLNAGIDLSYAHRFFTVKAGFEAASSSDTDPAKGWYIWRDRAKRAITAGVDVRPIDKLSISLSYEGRYGRHTFAPSADTAKPWHMVSTKDISNLNLGARYAFTPALTFFVNANNILNHRYYFSSTVPAPGFCGLIGAEYKF